jgi:hypothetical protein
MAGNAAGDDVYDLCVDAQRFVRLRVHLQADCVFLCEPCDAEGARDRGRWIRLQTAVRF